MEKTLQLKPLPARVGAGSVTRQCTLHRYDGDRLEDTRTLYFTFPECGPFPADDDADAYVLATVMDAMREGRRLIVNGSVSRELLSNLVEYQHIWHRWQPQHYALVAMEAATVRTPQELPRPGAISAFSGGVDATFTVYRHHFKQHGYRSQDLRFCVFVHGFDIPLSERAMYDSAFAHAQATLDDLGLRLLPLATNAREIASVNWEHAFTCLLAGALNQFKHQAGNCLIGSGATYDQISLHWGSSPVTDPLFSSDIFNVIHDGASHCRTGKVAAIAEWPAGRDHLRVCWKGEHKDRNCGECEKCLRTMACFLACGRSIPICFPDASPEQLAQKIKCMHFHNDAVRREWRRVIDYARGQGIEAHWLTAAEAALSRRPWKDRLLPPGSMTRLAARRLYHLAVPNAQVS